MGKVDKFEVGEWGVGKMGSSRVYIFRQMGLTMAGTISTLGMATLPSLVLWITGII